MKPRRTFLDRLVELERQKRRRAVGAPKHVPGFEWVRTLANGELAELGAIVEHAKRAGGALTDDDAQRYREIRSAGTGRLAAGGQP